jgi:primosomal protein N'
MTPDYRYVLVYVEHSFSDRAYPYTVPEELAELIEVGSRVLVPFGRRGGGKIGTLRVCCLAFKGR